VVGSVDVAKRLLAVWEIELSGELETWAMNVLKNQSCLPLLIAESQQRPGLGLDRR